MRGQIKLTLKGVQGAGRNNMADTTWNGTRLMNLTHEFFLEGVQPPYFAVLVDYHAEATLKSGRVIRSAYGGVGEHGIAEGMSRVFEKEMLGFTRALEAESHEETFQIFNYQPDQYPNEDLNGARIKGVITLEIRRGIVSENGAVESGRERGHASAALRDQRGDFQPGHGIFSRHGRRRFDVAR